MKDQPQAQTQASNTSATIRGALLLAAVIGFLTILGYGIAASPYHPYAITLVGVFVELVFAHLWFVPLHGAEPDER